jgi:hypothetical protein
METTGMGSAVRTQRFSLWNNRLIAEGDGEQAVKWTPIIETEH